MAERHGRWDTDADGITPLGVVQVEDATTEEQKKRNAKHAEILRKARADAAKEDAGNQGEAA